MIQPVRPAFLSMVTFLTVVTVAVVPRAGAQQQADAEPVNLLRLNSAAVERISVPGYSDDQLAATVDDDPSTVFNLPVAESAPIDIVYHFNSATVSPEKLVVQLPRSTEEAALPSRVEILVSRLSAGTGYRSLRADPLQATPEPQAFPFQPAAAQWVLVRITPHPQATEMAIAELAVLGREGPPVSRYDFKESPAEAFEVLEHLAESVEIGVSDAENALFVDAKDGSLDEVSFAEAALLASGVTDPGERRRMLERIAVLETQAEAVTAEADTAFAKGEQLLQWLHENVLSGGYDADQTDVSAILETETYNCVSSATIYNILGRRLQLDLRAIEVPDHAFSILYDGTRHADVETTNAQGFNPARNPDVLRELKETKGLHYVPERNRAKRREVDEAGLVALIYYNHGVQLAEEKRYAEALAAYFRALSLDREFSSAVQNVLAVLANWSKELGNAGTYERALDIVGIGLQLAPEDATLKHNREALWTNWAKTAMDAGEAQQALAILRRAHEAVPDGDFDAMQSWVFIRPAEKLIEQGNWDEAISFTSRGLNQIGGKARDELLEWRNGVFLRWSNAELDSGRFRQAADILARALEVDPGEKRFQGNLGYLAQQWSWSLHQEEDAAKAQSVLADMLERFPQVPAVSEAAENFVVRAVNELRNAGRYEQALETVAQLRESLQEEKTQTTLVRSVYDDWARAHMQDRDWTSAVAVYEEALQQHPDSQHFRQNLAYVAAQLAKAIATEKGNKESAAALAKLIQRHPQLAELKRAAESHVHGTLSALLNEDQFAKSQQTLEVYQDVLDQEQHVEAGRIIYDSWARMHTEKKEWQPAVEVYAKALKEYPDDAHLSNNAVATWNSWAAAHIKAREWDKAIEVYDQALKEFPDNTTLKNNREYCQQQLDDGNG